MVTNNNNNYVKKNLSFDSKLLIYQYLQNKPKFLLPELIMGILCAWISVIVTLLYPMAATGLIEYAALRGKSLDMYGLFGLWIIIGIVTGSFDLYRLIIEHV